MPLLQKYWLYIKNGCNQGPIKQKCWFHVGNIDNERPKYYQHQCLNASNVRLTFQVKSGQDTVNINNTGPVLFRGA